MPSPLETVVHASAAFETTLYDHPTIPRTSFPIALSILASLPIEYTPRETADRIHSLAPVLIALNEAVDIGISAQLRLESGVNQAQFLPLLHLSNLAMQNLQLRQTEFEHTYLERLPIAEIRHIINDFFYLSRNRKMFSQHEWKDYLEIDNGIFETLCLLVSVPHTLKEIGFHPTRTITSKEELKRKYSFLLTDFYRQTPKPTPQVRAIRALHSAAMLLKVNDDVIGYKTDRRLSIPNFFDYARSYEDTHNSITDIVNTLRAHYIDLASLYGVPSLITLMAAAASRVTSVLKEKAATRPNDKLLSVEDIDMLFFLPTQQTTLRHQLQGNGNPLNDLFR